MRLLYDLIRAFRFSIGAPVAALLVSLGAGAWGDRTAFALFLGAVIVSAFFEGRKGGWLATALTAGFLLVQYQLLPAESPARGVVDFGLSLGLLAAVGVLAGCLSGECRGALRASARYQDTLAHLSDGIILTDDNGRVAFLNEAARSLTGWSAKEAVGQPVEKVFSLLEEESRRPLKDPMTRSLDSRRGAAPAALLVVKEGAETLVEYRAEVLPGGASHRLLVFRDVGAQRGLEADLRQREERFRTLAACAPVGVLFLGPEGDCLFSNPACQAFGGFSAAEGLGRGWARSVRSEDQALVEGWLKAARQGKPYAAEFRFQEPGGAIRWIRIRSEVALSDRGKLLGTVGTLVEVNDCKELERAVMEQRQAVEELHRRHQEIESRSREQITALESARDSFQSQLAEHRGAHESLRHDHTHREEEWKRTEEKLQRRSAELTEANQALRDQLTGRQGAHEALRHDHARRAEEWCQTEAQLRQQVAGLTEANRHLESQHAECQAAAENLRQEFARGREEWKQAEEQLFQEMTQLSDAKDQIGQELTVSRQETLDLRQELEKQRQAERESCQRMDGEIHFFRSILTGLGEAVCVVDPNGAVTFVNPTAEQMLGWPASALLGKSIDETLRSAEVDGEALPALGAGMMKMLTSQPVLHFDRVRLRKSDGGAVTAACTLSAFGAHGQPEGAVLLFRDVTGRLQRESELRSAEDLLDRITACFRPALTALAEEIRNVKACLDQIPFGQSVAAQIEDRTHSLAALLNGLWLIRRIGRDELSVAKESVEVTTVIDQALETAGPVIRSRDHRVAVNLPLGPAWLTADSYLIGQALAALLSNAARYTEAGGQILLTAERCLNEVRFRVQDSGSGLVPEEIPSLLALDARARRFRPGVGDSLGIGLALARSLVELHGGRMTITGEPNRGSEFVLHLPASAPEMPALVQSAAVTPFTVSPSLLPFRPTSLLSPPN